MTDMNQSGANAAPETPVVAFEKPEGAPEAMNYREAGRLLQSLRKKDAAPAQAETRDPPAAPANEPASKEAGAAPPQEAPGETQETDPAEPPPIEAPRSWTKEEKAEFATYPREAQEKIARREQERERVVRQSQNEAAEKLKGLTAKEQAVEQARQQYETALPIVLQNLQTIMAGEFSDIKTMGDVTRLASEDWPRYVRWDAQQKQMAAVQQELQGAEARRVQEKNQKFTDFAKAEDVKLAEYVPELGDSEKAGKLQNSAISLLKDIGFAESELVEAYSGQKELSLRDHRIQRLIVDGVRYREMMANADKIKAKPLPPAQRPGVAQPKGSAVLAQVQTLANRLEKAKGPEAARIAAEMLRARRKAQA